MHVIYLKFFATPEPEFLAIVDTEEEVKSFISKYNLMIEKSGRVNSGIGIIKSRRVDTANVFLARLAKEFNLTDEKMAEIDKQLGGSEDGQHY